ncbi:MAG: ThuA domain-containing protein, partial [Acutalibacteraceae bacterium]
MIRVTVYNEFIHEKTEGAIKAIYPNGIHMALKENLTDDEIAVKTVTLDNVNDITDELLAETDVMLWWGHMRHDDVPDEVARRVQNAVLSGMGIIFLHSAHHSKPFKLLMGTP